MTAAALAGVAARYRASGGTEADGPQRTARRPAALAGRGLTRPLRIHPPAPRRPVRRLA